MPTFVKPQSDSLAASLLLAGLLMTATSGLAATKTGSPSDLEKCGEAKLSVLFWDVYVSTLYTPSGEYSQGIRPLRLDIRYFRSIKAEDLVEQTGKEWREQGLSDPRHKEWLNELLAIWPDVAEDDVISLQLDEAGAARFLFNGEPVGAITDPDFGRDFAGIWLSPKTTRPELREQLIGKS